ARGSATGSGSDGFVEEGGFENSALGGMLGMMGGGFGGGAGDASEARGASLIGSQYAMFQEILKVAIRKVTVNVTWQVMGRDRDLKIVVFFTDQSAMDKVLKGFGSSELPEDTGAGSGSGGSGSGSGKGSGSPRPPRTRGTPP
nr:hypothetical protein [Deltaproteobacteria bacterium]